MPRKKVWRVVRMEDIVLVRIFDEESCFGFLGDMRCVMLAGVVRVWFCFRLALRLAGF